MFVDAELRDISCLPVTSQDTAALIRYALRGIEQLFREGYRYKKAGVILTELVPAIRCRRICLTSTIGSARSG
jgi:hypothetical protein